MPTGPGSSGHRGGGESPYEEDAIARLSNQLVQLSARVDVDRQQRAKKAEAERKRKAGEVAAERKHTAAMLQDQLASMRQILEKSQATVLEATVLEATVVVLLKMNRMSLFRPSQEEFSAPRRVSYDQAG